MRASEKVAGWLEETLPALDPGKRLPPDHELARRLGVSVMTVRRTLGRYHREGRVERIWGRGTCKPAPLGTLPSSRTAAQSIADHLVALIQQGELRQGEALPSISVLSRQFRHAPATVITAYRQLQQQGHATKVGKSFFVGRFADLVRLNLHRPVYLFSPDKTDFAEVFESDTLHLAYRRAEQELMRHGFLLRCERLSRLSTLFRQWVAEQRLPYGLLFFRLDGPQTSRLESTLAKHWSWLKHAGIPLLVDSVHPFARANAGVHLLHRGTIVTAFARTLSRFLVAKRYHQIRFFFDAGEEFLGGKHALRYAVLRLIGELAGLDERCQVKLVIRTARPEVSAEEFCASHFAFAAEEFLYHRYPTRALQSLPDSLVLTSDFGQVLGSQRHADIWIFSRDEEAVAGLNWARQHRLSVPSRLSIIGMENTPRFYHCGLSHCGPDWETIGYLMGHSLIGDFAVERTSRGYVRTRAWVVERLTTR